MPLAKAYPAGGNVMVDNLWYKDAQEGIQVKPKVTILWTPSLPRLSKKNENLSSPMEKKRQRSNSKDLKHVSRSVRKQRRLPADCGSPCLSKLPFCNKHLQTSSSLTVHFTLGRGLKTKSWNIKTRIAELGVFMHKFAIENDPKP